MKTIIGLLLGLLILTTPLLAQMKDQTQLFADPRLKAECAKLKIQPSFGGGMYNSMDQRKVSPMKKEDEDQGKMLYPLLLEYRKDWEKACKTKKFKDFAQLRARASTLSRSLTFLFRDHQHSMLIVPEMGDVAQFLPGIEADSSEHGVGIGSSVELFDDWLRPQVDMEWVAFTAFQKEVHSMPWSRHSDWKCKPIGEYDYIGNMEKLLAQAKAREGLWPGYQEEYEKLMDESIFHLLQIGSRNQPLCKCIPEDQYQQSLKNLIHDFSVKPGKSFERVSKGIRRDIIFKRTHYSCK